MNFLTLAKTRCSTRSFKREQVSQDELALIFEAARVAPTNGNIQNFMIHVIQDQATLHNLYHYAQCYNAPTVLVVTYDTSLKFTSSINQNDSGLIDTSVILTHMMLQATDLSLGSVWINYFKQEPIRKLLHLPESIVVAHLLAVGYPAVAYSDANRHTTQRKPIEEIVNYVKETE